MSLSSLAQKIGETVLLWNYLPDVCFETGTLTLIFNVLFLLKKVNIQMQT